MKKDRQRDKPTPGHRDSMKESAKGQFFENRLALRFTWQNEPLYSKPSLLVFTNYVRTGNQLGDMIFGNIMMGQKFTEMSPKKKSIKECLSLLT